jgi:hypothetical protein
VRVVFLLLGVSSSSSSTADQDAEDTSTPEGTTSGEGNISRSREDLYIG